MCSWYCKLKIRRRYSIIMLSKILFDKFLCRIKRVAANHVYMYISVSNYQESEIKTSFSRNYQDLSSHRNIYIKFF